MYKEDFNKIVAGLSEVVEHVKSELMPNYDFTQFDRDEDEEYNAKSSKDDEEPRNRLQWD